MPRKSRTFPAAFKAFVWGVRRWSPPAPFWRLPVRGYLPVPNSSLPIITSILIKSKRKIEDFPPSKIFRKNFKSGVDSHDKLWYPVVTARLVNSNHSCGGFLQGLRGKQIPPFHSLFFWKRTALWFALYAPRGGECFWYGALCKSKKTKTGHIA